MDDPFLTAEFLTNREIRLFLEHFSPAVWKTALKYALIYGIQALKRHHDVQHLSISQLKEILERNELYQTIEDHIPEIQRGVQSIAEKVNEWQSNIGMRPPSEPLRPSPPAPQAIQPPRPPPQASRPPLPPSSRPPTAANRSLSRERRTPFPEQFFFKPPSSWRAGDSASPHASLQLPAEQVPPPPPPSQPAVPSSANSRPATAAPPNMPSEAANVSRRSVGKRRRSAASIYPDWWPAPPPPKPHHLKHRKQPRLAYSVNATPRAHPIYEDDLVTARYLKVKSSGYGAKPPATAFAATAHPTDQSRRGRSLERGASAEGPRRSRSLPPPNERHSTHHCPADRSHSEAAAAAATSRAHRATTDSSRSTMPNAHATVHVRDVQPAREPAPTSGRARRDIPITIFTKDEPSGRKASPPLREVPPRNNHSERHAKGSALHIAEKFLGGPLANHFATQHDHTRANRNPAATGTAPCSSGEVHDDSEEERSEDDEASPAPNTARSALTEGELSSDEVPFDADT